MKTLSDGGDGFFRLGTSGVSRSLTLPEQDMHVSALPSKPQLGLSSGDLTKHQKQASIHVGVSHCIDYPTGMRNTNNSYDLWKIQSSDYPADMWKSIRDKEIWPSALFAMRGGACARARSLVVSPSNRRYLDTTYFPWRTQSFYSFRFVASVDELIRAGPLTSWQNSRSVRLKRSGADPGKS
jgi:hypothetical protein